ncbi:MAG TPA: histidine kinase [Mucilaginibacter sp.]|nr:histidine kinase [Mucilaginibacter sp.]
MAFILNAAIFYINADFILSRLSSHKNYAFVFLEIVVLISLYLLISYGLSLYVFPLVDHDLQAQKGPILTKLFFARHIWRAVYFLGLSTGYWLTKKTVNAERKFRLLEKEQYVQNLNEKELKRQMAISHLAFIKSQINPHFLHNTLSFFYSNIYPLSKQLAESILLLSEMMRYSFHPTDKDGLIELSVELKQIENYIKLNQLRFDNKLHINFDINGNPEGKRIISFLLMTLVENAFKYGDLMDEHYPLTITGVINNNKLQFQIINKKKQNIHEFESHGIGIKNIESQLKLMYANDYKLEIDAAAYEYKCMLELKNL